MSNHKRIFITCCMLMACSYLYAQKQVSLRDSLVGFWKDRTKPGCTDCINSQPYYLFSANNNLTIFTPVDKEHYSIRRGKWSVKDSIVTFIFDNNEKRLLLKKDRYYILTGLKNKVLKFDKIVYNIPPDSSFFMKHQAISISK